MAVSKTHSRADCGQVCAVFENRRIQPGSTARPKRQGAWTSSRQHSATDLRPSPPRRQRRTTRRGSITEPPRRGAPHSVPHQKRLHGRSSHGLNPRGVAQPFLAPSQSPGREESGRAAEAPDAGAPAPSLNAGLGAPAASTARPRVRWHRPACVETGLL